MTAVPSVDVTAPWPDALNMARGTLAPPSHPTVFSLHGVGVRYGLVQALQGVNLSVTQASAWR